MGGVDEMWCEFSSIWVSNILEVRWGLLWVIVLVFPQVGDLRMMDLSSKMMGVIKGVCYYAYELWFNLGDWTRKML